MTTEVFLSRRCEVEPVGGGAEPTELRLQVMIPERDEVSGSTTVRVRIACPFFEDEVEVAADDDFAAVSAALLAAQAQLSLRVVEGFAIRWWDYTATSRHFWMGEPTPSDRGLPSTFNRDNFGASLADDHRFGNPSFRVAIDSGEFLITVYEVQKDGMDVRQGFCRADQARAEGGEQTAFKLGQHILMDTRIGRRLYGFQWVDRKVDQSRERVNARKAQVRDGAEAVLSRRCSVGDRPLWLHVYRPDSREEEDDAECWGEIVFGQQRRNVWRLGIDEIGAYLSLLQLFKVELAYWLWGDDEVLWRQQGDVRPDTFWGAAGGPWEAMPGGDDVPEPERFLTPGHRVEVTADAIIVYRVRPDGSETMLEAIPAPGSRTADGLARYIGGLVLNDTALGRTLAGIGKGA